MVQQELIYKHFKSSNPSTQCGWNYKQLVSSWCSQPRDGWFPHCHYWTHRASVCIGANQKWKRLLQKRWWRNFLATVSKLSAAQRTRSVFDALQCWRWKVAEGYVHQSFSFSQFTDSRPYDHDLRLPSENCVWILAHDKQRESTNDLRRYHVKVSTKLFSTDNLRQRL